MTWVGWIYIVAASVSILVETIRVVTSDEVSDRLTAMIVLTLTALFLLAVLFVGTGSVW